jgi:hypothetical protein
MSENNLTDRISETITNTFKKTEIFEKFSNYKFYINSFLIITSIIGTLSIYMNMMNRLDIININEDIKANAEENKNILKYHIEINDKRNLIEYCSLKSDILTLNKQFVLLLENQEKIINQLCEIKLINNSEENRLSINISKFDSCSINKFSPIKMPLILDQNNSDNIKEDEYDELLNECYDTMPLNNLKKNTGLSWFF